MKRVGVPRAACLGVGLLYLVMTACSSSTCPAGRVGGTGACISDESASMQNATTAHDDAGGSDLDAG
jgi:hypothetical protein